MSDKRFAMLSTEALHSRKIDSIPLDLEAVYYRLHLASDKFGTMPGSARDVRSRAFPTRGVTEDAIAEALDKLADAKLIERWCELDGEHEGEWLNLTRFDRNCSSDYMRKRTRYTPVPPSQRTPIDPVPAPFPPRSRPVPGNDATTPVPSRSRPVPVPRLGEMSVENPLSLADAEADRWRRMFQTLQSRQITDAELVELMRDAARSGPREIPAVEEGEPLHVTEGSGGGVSDPGESPAATPADALDAGLDRLARKYDPFAPHGASLTTERGAAAEAFGAA